MFRHTTESASPQGLAPGILSFVSFHYGIADAFKAAEALAKEKRGGEVYWVLEDRVARWENLEVFPGTKMSIWLFGSGIRQKNSVIARVGWWKLWLVDALTARVAGRPIPRRYAPRLL